jgi:hypothetical protein
MECGCENPLHRILSDLIEQAAFEREALQWIDGLRQRGKFAGLPQPRARPTPQLKDRQR